MKDILNYYYDIYPSEISHIKDRYSFEDLNNKYVLESFKRPLEDAKCLYEINEQMSKKNILVHKIILNKDDNVLTFINNTPYVLMEIYINESARVILPEICYISNNTVGITCNKILNRYDWSTLWSKKNDYIEGQISEISRRFPNLSNYINYYIGLCENAILYFKQANKIEEQTLISVCHKRTGSHDTFYDLYNPLNYIFDYRVRDSCEYIKNEFFKGNNAYDLVLEYFNNNYLSYKEAMLFYSRLLYPSYFYDLYDEIINTNLNESVIEEVVSKTKEYEKFLLDVYLFLSKLYSKYFPEINWITKRSLI